MCFWLSCAIDMFTRLNYINFTAFFQFYLSVVCFSLMLHGVLHNWRENYPFIRHLWSKQQHKVSPCISFCVCVFTACPTKMMLQLFCCLVLLFGNSVAQSNGKFLFFMMTIKKKESIFTLIIITVSFYRDIYHFFTYLQSLQAKSVNIVLQNLT